MAILGLLFKPLIAVFNRLDIDGIPEVLDKALAPINAISPPTANLMTVEAALSSS
jgi:hypothetical protein